MSRSGHGTGAGSERGCGSPPFFATPAAPRRCSRDARSSRCCCQRSVAENLRDAATRVPGRETSAVGLLGRRDLDQWVSGGRDDLDALRCPAMGRRTGRRCGSEARFILAGVGGVKPQTTQRAASQTLPRRLSWKSRRSNCPRTTMPRFPQPAIRPREHAQESCAHALTPALIASLLHRLLLISVTWWPRYLTPRAALLPPKPQVRWRDHTPNDPADPTGRATIRLAGRHHTDPRNGWHVTERTVTVSGWDARALADWRAEARRENWPQLLR